jgi:hypothetical protein
MRRFALSDRYQWDKSNDEKAVMADSDLPPPIIC